MKTLFSLIILFSLKVHALECRIDEDHTFDDLNVATVSDTDIITEDDRLFCPDQNLKNSDISPENLPDDGSLWRVGNRRWNDDWEKKYQQWVKEEVTSSIFEELNFPTDCADAALTIRAIFARIHHLPVSFGGTQFLHTSKDYTRQTSIPHWNEKNWKEDFKKDKRFQTAVNDWNKKIGTINLDKDTYQIELTDKVSGGMSSCVAPGTIFLSDGHAEFMTFNDSSIFPYRLSSSTVPSKVRPLAENIIYGFNLEDQGTEKGNKTRGYLWWNWTINCKGKFTKVADEKMPYYSNEQELIMKGQKQNLVYDINKMFQDSLGLSKYELDKKFEQEIKNLIVDIDNSVLDRQAIIVEGLQVCSAYGVGSARDCFATQGKNGNGFTLLPNGIAFHPDIEEDRCEGDCPPELPKELKPENVVEVVDLENYFAPKSPKHQELYYNFSTPSRDKRLLERLQNVKELIHGMQDQEAREKFNEFLMDKTIELKNGKKISYYHLSKMYYVSPQPWDAEDLRWGAAEMPSIRNDFNHLYKDYISLHEQKKKESPAALKKFEEDNKLFIKEKNLIDEYFK